MFTCLPWQNIGPTVVIHSPANSFSLIHYFGKYTYLSIFLTQSITKCFICRISCNPFKNMFFPHFVDEKSETPSGEVTWLKSLRQHFSNPGFQLGSSWIQSLCSFYHIRVQKLCVVVVLGVEGSTGGYKVVLIGWKSTKWWSLDL